MEEQKEYRQDIWKSKKHRDKRYERAKIIATRAMEVRKNKRDK
jgi:hypothetical protein